MTQSCFMCLKRVSDTLTKRYFSHKKYLVIQFFITFMHKSTNT